jgi:hypothetical protein
VAVHELWPTIDLVTLGTSCHRHVREASAQPTRGDKTRLAASGTRPNVRACGWQKGKAKATQIR